LNKAHRLYFPVSLSNAEEMKSKIWVIKGCYVSPSEASPISLYSLSAKSGPDSASCQTWGLALPRTAHGALSPGWSQFKFVSSCSTVHGGAWIIHDWTYSKWPILGLAERMLPLKMRGWVERPTCWSGTLKINNSMIPGPENTAGH
jgi:hypothetical protein